MEPTLDYLKLWKTLLRTGIKDRFSVLRSEFFMKIATDGPRVYKGEEALNQIVSESEAFKLCPEMKERLDLAISKDDEFKHYSYRSENGTMLIEYFANRSNAISKELIDKSGINDYQVDGYCGSWAVDFDVPERGETESEEEELTEKTANWATIHFIVIAECSEGINPETYPRIIKHELTHACLYEMRKLFRTGYYQTLRVPATWTDKDIASWNDDLKELYRVLESKDEECEMFKEFISDFLMYESDGQTKERNPIVESRVPKATKPDAKPRVTYRTLNPVDRFEENMDQYDEIYHDWFQLILDTLKPAYDKYDELLDDTRM